MLALVFLGIGAISRLKANKNARHGLDLWRVHNSKCKRLFICLEIAAFSVEIFEFGRLYVSFSHILSSEQFVISAK